MVTLEELDKHIEECPMRPKPPAERYLAEAEKFVLAAEEELERGLSSGEDELIRDAAEKAWNAVVQATTALLLAKGYTEESIKTYRQKRLALEELALKDGDVAALGLPDRLMAREYTLHIRCFYDGEYTSEAIKGEVRKAMAYVADVSELVRRGGPAREKSSSHSLAAKRYGESLRGKKGRSNRLAPPRANATHSTGHSDQSSSTLMRADELARRIDYAIVKPNITVGGVELACREAAAYGLRGVCVAPCHVELAAGLLEGSGVRVCAVVGFPFGFTLPDVKAREAELVVELGASDIDMVMNVSALKSGLHELVLEDIMGVVEEARTRGCIVKVIVEACYLTEEELKLACELAVHAGADFVKTSTGVGPGGATAEAVRLMKAVVRGRAGVKAAGGIRTYEDAMAMMEAGADLIGTSTPGPIIDEAKRRAR